MASATVTIDDPDQGGSDPGAWLTAIAHTPHLAAQRGDTDPLGIGFDLGREIETRAAGFAPVPAVRAGGVADQAPQVTRVTPPGEASA